MSDGTRQALVDKRADLLVRMAGISAAPSDSGGISFGKRVGDGTSIAVDGKKMREGPRTWVVERSTI